MEVVDYKKIATTVAITVILGLVTTAQGIAFAPQMQVIAEGDEVKIMNTGWAQAKEAKVEIIANNEFSINVSDTDCIEGEITPTDGKSKKYGFELTQFSTNVVCMIKFDNNPNVQKVTIIAKDTAGFEWKGKGILERIGDAFLSFVIFVGFLAVTIAFGSVIVYYYLSNRTSKKNILKNQKLIQKHEQTIQKLKISIDALESYKDNTPKEDEKKIKLSINKLRIKNELVNKYKQKISSIKENITETITEEEENVKSNEEKEQSKAKTPEIIESDEKFNAVFSKEFRPKEKTVEEAKPKQTVEVKPNPLSVKILNTNYKIKYYTDNRCIDSIQHDPIAQSLKLKFSKRNEKKSILKIFLTDNIIKSEIDSTPEKFFVCFDGEEGFVKESKDNTERTISFELDKDIEEVEIIGTELPFLN